MTFSNAETGTLGLDKMGLVYLIRKPLTSPARNKAIILLHGVGSNEKDLFAFAAQLPGDFFVIAPRGPFNLGAGRYAWYQVDFSSGKPVIDASQEASSREAIGLFIKDVKEKYNLAEIYLGGFSQGAIMSYSIGLIHPETITGILSLSGRILQEIRSLVQAGTELQHVNFFIAHGTHDTVLPVHYAREAGEYLQTLGVSFTYHEYAMGHQVSKDVLDDISRWLDQSSLSFSK